MYPATTPVCPSSVSAYGDLVLWGAMVMRSLSIAGVAAVFAVAFTQIATAADLPVKAPVYNAPPVAVAYNWTGFYVGGNVGYSWGKSNADTLQGPAQLGVYGVGPCDNNGIGPALGCAFSQSSNPKGFIGGVQAGYNYQTGVMVWGLEADFDWRNQTDSSTHAFNSLFDHQDASSTQRWVGTLRGRMGYAPTNNWLAYISGGLAFGNFEHSVTQQLCYAPAAIPCDPSRSFTDSVTKAGWVLGGGLDYAINSHWSVGAEYLYMKFNSDTLSASAFTYPSPQPFGPNPRLYPAASVTFNESSQVFRVKANYKFN